jgi:7-cyano-7-deazaguanine synthase in queuosine biosynthesis
MKRKRKAIPQTFSPEAPSDAILKEFGSWDLAGINALTIGNAIFEAEQILRSRKLSKITIPLYHSAKGEYDLHAISRLIRDLLIFTVVEDVEVEFRQVDTQLSFEYPNPRQVISSVCLFSGGTDSYSGILHARKKFDTLQGVFCAHADQSRIIHIVEQLREKILQPTGIELLKVGVPNIEAKGYAQVRGFLYILAATAVADKLGSQKIVITECGPTMYQPRFSPLDSITMTTHPFVVRTAAAIARLLLRRELDIILPFEDLTKAEVIAICPEKEGLKLTHSCITQRFGMHDGTCYGCVIRRLATIATAVEDVRYIRNPLSDAKAHAGNLYSLLDFCYQLLTNFSQMEEYERGVIDTYGKRNLFRRFALDNFSAIHKLLSHNKRVVRPIRDMYESLVQRIGTKDLDTRLEELSNPNLKPDFKKLAN